jgi:L-iditol 2-dehydrogenase
VTAVRAAVMPAPGAPIEIRSFDTPDLEPGAALLETLASEVCGTDVHLWHGRLEGVPYPIIPGHVSVGRIAALRPPLDDIEGRPFREGDVVTFLDVHGTCGACWYCLVAKETTRCPRRKVYGITYGAGDGLLGGWAERIWIRPGVHLLRLPDGLDPRTFVGGGCGAVTAYHAVRRGGVRLGDAVVVLGAGPVGQSAAAFAALSGAGLVIVVGAPEERLVMARRMGADETLSIEMRDHAARRAAIRTLTRGRGADVVIEAAGAPEAVVEGADLCRDGGVLVVAGQYTDTGDVRLNPHAMINRKHLEVRGCWGSDFSHFHGALAVMARHQGRVPWAGLICRWYGLEEAGEALRAVADRAILKAGIAPGP